MKPRPGASPGYQNKAFPARSVFQGHPVHRPLPRPPIPSLRPPRPDPIQRPLPRPDRIPKATPAYPNSSATSQALNTPFTPRPEPSHKPFEPHRDQVRRDAIARSRHIPRGEGTKPRTPRFTPLHRCSPCSCRPYTPTNSAHTEQPAAMATASTLVLSRGARGRTRGH